MHDYNDLAKVKGVDEKGKEALGNYINKEARGFARLTRAAFQVKSTHLWLTE
jgi:hypothetical protein